jgi:hypothetical protein
MQNFKFPTNLGVSSVKKMPFGGQICFPTSFLFKSIASKSCIMLMPPNGNPNEAFQEPQKA